MQYNNSGVDHNVYMLATIQSIVQSVCNWQLIVSNWLTYSAQNISNSL